MIRSVSRDTYRVGVRGVYKDGATAGLYATQDTDADVEGYVYTTPAAAVERYVNIGNFVGSGTLTDRLTNTLALLSDPLSEFLQAEGYSNEWENVPDEYLRVIRLINGRVLDEATNTTRNVSVVTLDFDTPAADLL